MKNTLTSFLVVILSLLAPVAMAQQRTVSGTVVDETGQPLPGVNIVITGTQTGTSTDFDGKYTLEVNKGQKLKFSYLGYAAITKAVGVASTIDVALEPAKNKLDEVVVTALGISREKKSLGYATQEIKPDQVAAVKTDNFVNSLSGQAAGVQIRRTTNMGGSTNIVIRGNASLAGDNQALFVIDGVPISNLNTNSKEQRKGGASYDYGNAASDINPDDIASINILKGAAATALYGSRAANGAVIITTKSGANAKGIGLTINTGITVGLIDRSTFPEYQTQYGAGYGQRWLNEKEDFDGDGLADKVASFVDDASYGMPFNPNLDVVQWYSLYKGLSTYKQKGPWVAAKHGPIDFFETPVTLNNTVSLNKGGKRGNYRFSYTNFRQKGLLPNSELRRDNASLKASYKLTDKWTANAFANYIKTDGLGRNKTGYGDGIVQGFRQWWETNVDLEQLKQTYFETGKNTTWNPHSTTDLRAFYWNNPYWDRYKSYESDQRSRLVAYASLNYQLNDWLQLFGRLSVDNYSQLEEERLATGSFRKRFGIGKGPDHSESRDYAPSGYSRKNINFSEFNYDAMLNADRDITDKLHLRGILGANIQRTALNSIWAATNGGLTLPGLYSLKNSVFAIPTIESDQKTGIDGIYASTSLGYDGYLFLDATLRRDVASTLPKANNTYYYPSVSTSFVFSKFIHKDWLSFGKLRLNYAEVGKAAGFDMLQDSYRIDFPFRGTSISRKEVKNNPELRPERTKSYEFGLETAFLKRKLSLDLSLYDNRSIDQIFRKRVSFATGYKYKVVNGGEIQNRGIEVSLNGTPVQTDRLSWKVAVNWSKNQSKVLSLNTVKGNFPLATFQGGISLNAEVGKPYGLIKGSDYIYKDGKRVVDQKTGEYKKTADKNHIIGDINPDWVGGITNTLTYKNLSLSFLIDMQKGGDIFSLDMYYGLATGLYKETAFTNDLGKPVRNPISKDGGMINPGVTPDGEPNKKRVDASGYSAFGYKAYPDKAFVYDAGFIKLRQVALSYRLPKKWLKDGFIRNAVFSLVGSNLWIIHKNLPYADPESGLGSGNVQGISMGSLPSTRDIAFNVKLQF